jgi:hypothetical protein
MADFQPGSMDTTAQEKAFNGLMTIVRRAVITIVIALILLAIVNG